MLAADAIHKTDPDFKLIYGCEAYFVDDMIPCVYGVKDEPLNGEDVYKRQARAFVRAHL